ncbi:MAG: SDR family oxidoreductase [Chloroflexota bacterium]
MPDDRVILITGCSSGMGMEAAVALARRGHRVYATMRDPGRQGDLKKRFAEEGASGEIMRLDVTDAASVDDCVRHIESKEKRLDVLINNAGIGFKGTLESAAMAEIQAVFATNLQGTVRCIQAVLPVMKRQNSGLIINVSSALGVIGISFASVYVASKFAVEGLSESLHEELRHFSIKIRLIEPGIVETRYGANAIRGSRTYDHDAPYLGAENEARAVRAGLPRQSSREAAQTFVRAVEDESARFRFPVGEIYARAIQRKLADPATFTPLSA